MKKVKELKLFFILFLLIQGSLHAQLEPFFEMTLYFEDAVGNRDSVSFGYDREATEDIDEEFGEIELTAPFDSVFDVRIGNFEHDILSKRMINSTGIFVNDTTCFSGSSAIIYINSIHQPIKVWWDKAQLLNNECFRGGFIINHIADLLAGPFELDEIPPIYHCMSSIDTVFFDVTEEALTSEWPRITIEKEIEGQGITTIYGLRIDMTPSWAFTPCYWVTEVNEIVKMDEIMLYPNPAMGEITPVMDDEKNIQQAMIYDSTGRKVWQWQSQGLSYFETINVSSFQSGLYRIKIYTGDKKIFIGSFVKR